MKKSSLLALWGILYIICAGLGFIPAAEGSVRVFLMMIAVLFFVPPAILLFDARQNGDAKMRKLIRNLSIASLVLTVVLMIANILSSLTSETLGGFVHVLLVLVSAPMFCSNYWALSLFCWAALMVASLKK